MEFRFSIVQDVFVSPLLAVIAFLPLSIPRDGPKLRILLL
jgi:hypothetical protein